ncbi:TerB family tellurite resistance protein [Pleurocapsales cyanobacterium LEGE 10410]|nr:TerB family tellurite resistance protein [Pleurocapsales cyanobacterium LEGE 10410]
MAQLTENNQDLFEILVAVAWLDGEVQLEEREFLEKIAAQQNLKSAAEVQDLLANHRTTSSAECYQLLEKYLGSNPNLADYQNLLSAVSSLIYSDNDIATEEASLLTQIQNLNPDNLKDHSAFDNLIGKIQKLYRAGLNKK